MTVLLILAVTLFVLAGATLALRRSLAGATAGNQLGDSIALLSQTNDSLPVDASLAQADRRQIIRPLSRPLRLVPYVIGALISLTLGLLTSIPFSIVAAIGVVIALLLAQLESGWYAWRLSRIERQLIDLLDMMIPMLRSGAGASAALAAASEVTASPLRDQIHWCVRRIQLGDSGSSVFRELARRMPIDAMELFSTTMSVHWETGGSLAPVLASVARVARDRQEVARRIRSNIAQSQFSTIAVLLLIYFVALVLWLDRPDVMKEFASSSLGSVAIAATIVLQAVGIVWMNAISRPKA